MNHRLWLRSLLLSALLFESPVAGSAADVRGWQPAEGPLGTRWSAEVRPGNALPEYPRPQMVRERWRNLNGLWEYAVTPREAAQPEQWTGEILVPFPIESALSGIKQRVSEQERLWYRRTFRVPRGWRGQRVLLHFGAVDWETSVVVNGVEMGSHRGGYDAFPLTSPMR